MSVRMSIFGLRPIHFGAISLVQQEGASEQMSLRPEKQLKGTKPPAGWESHDLVSLKNHQSMASVAQSPNAKTDVKLFNGKGGLVAIVTTNDLRFLALQGSHIELKDTIVDLPGAPITGSSIVNDATGSKSPVQHVTKQAMILGAGLSSRLEPFAGPETLLPKPALPLVGDRSIIVDIAKNLYEHGIEHIVVNTFYMPKAIESQLKAFNEQLKMEGKKPLKITFISENAPSGTAGGLVKALEAGVVNKDEPMLIVQGDSVNNIDYSHLINEHTKHGAKVTIAYKQVADDEIKLYGMAVTDRTGKDGQSGHIETFVEKPKTPEAVAQLKGSRLGSTGIYVISPAAFSEFYHQGSKLLNQGQIYDYANDFLTPLSTGKKNLWAEKINGYWNDVGNGESLVATFKDIANGKMGPKMAAEARKNLDQNGVIYWDNTRDKVQQLNAQHQQQGSPFQLKGNIVVANVPN